MASIFSVELLGIFRPQDDLPLALVRLAGTSGKPLLLLLEITL